MFAALARDALLRNASHTSAAKRVGKRYNTGAVPTLHGDQHVTRSTTLTAMTLLIALGLLASVAAAQAPTAPPQSGDRLRNLGGQLLEGFLKPQTAPQEKKPLDFAAINNALELVIKPVLTGDATLDVLSLTFDPAQTDFAKDTLRLKTVAGLRRSVWSSAPSQWNSDLSATADLKAPGGAKASIETQIMITTDVVGLANFALQKRQAKIAAKLAETQSSANPPSAIGGLGAQAEQQPAPVDATPVSFAAELLERKLLEMRPIKTFDDLADTFQMFASLQFLTANEKIETLKAQIASASDDVAREKFSKELLAARTARDKAADIRLRIVRDDAGHANALYVTMAAAQSEGIVQLEKLDLVVQATDIRVALQARVTKGVELYAVFKPIIVNTLEKLQNRDPATIETQRNMVRGWLPRVRRALEEGEF